MIQKETFNSAVKNHDFDVLVSFERRDDLGHFQNAFRTEDVERRGVKCYSPIRRRTPSQPYLHGPCCWWILGFHFFSPLSFLFYFFVSVVFFCTFFPQLCGEGPHRETREADRCEAQPCPPSPSRL